MNCYNIRVCGPDALWPTWSREIEALGPWSLRDARPLAVKAHGLSEELGRLLASLVQGAGGRFVRQVSADGASDMWVSASESGLRQALAALHAEGSAGAVALADELHAALTRAQRQVSPSCRIGSREFVWAERTHVMGIVNVTPDSFSGDGLLAAATDVTERDVERAVGLALQMLSDGADLIDVGGESTRPGASSLTAAQELARVLPVIQRLARETDAPISVDTYRASVAAAALQAGAGLVNDVWGLRMDPDMGPVVAAHGAPIVIMHNRSKPRNAAQEERLGGRYVGVHYDNLIADVLRELRGQVGQALACGIREDGIIIDPGIGFGKTVEQNLALLDQIGELRVLGYPILLGPSRKSFIGYTLDLPPEERLEGTLATVVAGVLRGGAQIVRVHDVRATVRAVRMADAIRAAGKAL